MLFIRFGRDEESERAALLLAVRVNGMQSRFSLLSLFYFVNERKEALPTRARVVLCVFITLKPGSRKAEQEGRKKKKEKIFSPTDLSRSCSAPLFFLSLLFPTVFREKYIKTTPYVFSIPVDKSTS
jgi:hypothetical protein